MIRIYSNGRTAIKILLNYFRDGINVPWDDSSRIDKLTKKYINAGFEDKFIKLGIAECEQMLRLDDFPKEWIEKEAGNIGDDYADYREFLEKLLQTLQLQFNLQQERKENYCFKDIFKISQETKEFYDNKYRELSCLNQYFQYYYNDADSVKKLMFEQKRSTIIKIKEELENLLKEDPFPYKWLANSLQRKSLNVEGVDVCKQYYNWVSETLKLLQTVKNIQKAF